MDWLNKAILDQFGLSVELKEDVATLVTSGASVAPQPVAASIDPALSTPSALQNIKPPPKPPETKRAASLDPTGQPMEIRPASQQSGIKPAVKPPVAAPAFPKGGFSPLGPDTSDE